MVTGILSLIAIDAALILAFQDESGAPITILLLVPALNGSVALQHVTRRNLGKSTVDALVAEDQTLINGSNKLQRVTPQMPICATSALSFTLEIQWLEGRGRLE